MAERRVTVFGGTGFIGRHLVSALVADGARVRVVARRADRATLPAGATAQPGSVADEAAVIAAVEDAGAIVNLVGVLTPRGAQTFAALHEAAPGYIGRAAARAGVDRVVHVSALAVDEDAPSAADRSKAAGERALFAACPWATVMRPSLVYGPDDHFFSRFAALARRAPLLPLAGAQTRFQPLDVEDLVAALCKALERADVRGRIYEAGGSRTYTLRRLVELACAEVGAHPRLLSLPFALAEPLGVLLQALPQPPLTRDQVRLLRSDKVVSGTTPTLADLDIAPRSLESRLPQYLAKYRRSGNRA